jgi:hypothetical protein
MFRVAPPLELKKLEAIFQHKVFKMLLKKGRITKEMIAMLSTWRHSAFHVFCGNRISPDEETAMENLARYIIRASFSQERMQYLDQEGKVVYTSKACPEPRSGDGRTSKSFPALEWLANLRSHIPNRGEQMVRYYSMVVRSQNADPKPIAPIFNFAGRGGIGGRKREGSMLRRGLLRHFFKAQDHCLDMVEDVMSHRRHVEMDDQI